MEDRQLEFFLDAKAHLDALETKYGESHPKIIALKEKFFTQYKKDLPKPEKPPLNALKTELDAIHKEIQYIRKKINIEAKPSIDYSFIRDVNTKVQLQADNISMENQRLKIIGNESSEITDKEDQKRFKMFCVFACYQLEILLRFYFDSNDIISHHIYKFSKKHFSYQDRNESPNYKNPNYIIMEGLRCTRNIVLHRLSIPETSDEIQNINNQIIDLTKKSKEYYELHDEKYTKTDEEKNLESLKKSLDLLSTRNYDDVTNALRNITEKIRIDKHTHYA